MNDDYENLDKPQKEKTSAAGAVALALLFPGLITAILLFIFLVDPDWLAEMVHRLVF